MATRRTRSTTKPRTSGPPVPNGLPPHLPEAALSQTFLEVAPDAIIIADAAGRMRLANHQAEVLFGYARPELLGRSIELLLPERFHVVHQRHRSDYVAQPHTRPMGAGLELFGKRQDGAEFPVEVSLSPQPIGDDVFVIAIIRDISERKRLEAVERAAFAAAEARRLLLQTVLDELPGGAYLVRGADATLVMANRAAEAVWGAPWPEGEPMAAFLRTAGVQLLAQNGQPLALAELATMRVVRTGKAERQVRVVVRRPDGSRLPILLSGVPLDLLLLENAPAPHLVLTEPTTTLSATQKEHAALLLMQDVTSIQEADQLKDEFISLAAHELRNPMAAIQGFASMLAQRTARGQGPGLADWQQEAIAEIETATMRLNELTKDLLDVTRIQAGRLELHPTRQDLVALVRRCLSRVQMTTTRHALALDDPGEAVLVEVDGLRLEQVITNLLGNAIKYSPHGGAVQVGIRADPAIGVGEVRIRDSGIGIPANQQAQLFRRFARAANVHDHNIPGTGLGLYVSRELIERHGGHVWFESIEGEGTTFFLTLPLAASSCPSSCH